MCSRGLVDKGSMLFMLVSATPIILLKRRKRSDLATPVEKTLREQQKGRHSSQFGGFATVGVIKLIYVQG